MNVLEKVDVLSTISGGSITGAYYCLNADNFDSFEKELYQSLQTKNVIKHVFLSITFLRLLLFGLFFLVPAFYFLFTANPWFFLLLVAAFFLLLFKFQFFLFPVSSRIEDIYNKFFFKGKHLGNLKSKPILVIGSTNLQTARPFTFSKDRMQDSTYTFMKPGIEFRSEKFPVARAVMASSCVPFAFTPVKIAKEFFMEKNDFNRVHPILVDGGVYDNQGIHKITQSGSYSCESVITSDAGGGSTGELSTKNVISLLLATFDVFMSRIKKNQMIDDIYENKETANRQIAYLSLAWDVENCIPGFISNLSKKIIPDSVITILQLKYDWVSNPEKYEPELTEHLKSKTNYNKIDKPTEDEKKIARRVGTNLTSLSKTQVDCLMKQASALTELQVKLYCPSLLI